MGRHPSEEAGRRPMQRYTTRLPEGMISTLRKMPNASKFVRETLREGLKNRKAER